MRGLTKESSGKSLSGCRGEMNVNREATIETAAM
jgi:hypothetical protein